jgi:hypothetical protein
MGKAAYLAHNVLGAVNKNIDLLNSLTGWGKDLVAERFWSKVERTETCWLWKGDIRDGYGRFWDGEKHKYAHRYSWVKTFGPIDTKTPFVCHACDVKNCVRPDHLFLGTADDNMKDAAEKGRLLQLRSLATENHLRAGGVLARNVLGATHKAQEWLESACGYAGTPSCSAAHKALQTIEGLGSFLAAQVVADLKNTVGHPLQTANDWWTFVAHGPGSIRGLQWFWQAEGVTITPSNFLTYFKAMREYVDENWDETAMGAAICNQDLQNCLCEFDKYCRVSSGSGRSKRNYPGNA